MFRLIPVLVIPSFLLAACQPAVTGTSIPAAFAPTLTATLVPSATALPSETPAPPTITPLPTIPTFTPTFDVRTIVTATPAPKAVCPKEDPSVKIDFQFPVEFGDLSSQTINDQKVLDYLNKGGKLSTLIDGLQASFMRDRYKVADLTGDGVKDLLIEHFLGVGYKSIRIYSCTNGSYKSFPVIGDDWDAIQHTDGVVTIEDLNKDGIPEIVISDGPGLIIVEWQGDYFKPFGLGGSHSLSRRPEIKDIDHDGLDEIIFTGQEVYYFGYNEDVYTGAPWRDEIVVFSWDGNEYIQHPSEYSAPEYRFQAVQDGDRLTLRHNYEQALELYQSVIFSDRLKEWSPDMHNYELGILDANINSLPTPTLPAPDPAEYPLLAAYAYYRMVILHIHLGQMDAASTQYTTLQDKFPAGNPGHPYAEMASAFWNAYQSTGKMYPACAAAIAYADAHPEILVPLGSDYHGAQSHLYTPADVCPFR